MAVWEIIPELYVHSVQSSLHATRHQIRQPLLECYIWNVIIITPNDITQWSTCFNLVFISQT